LAPHPAIRASVVRDALNFLETFEPRLRSRVLERVPRASREVIAAADRLDWIPVEHDHHIVDAVVDILGRERAMLYWRDGVVDAMGRPLLRNFVSGMFRFLGRSPAAVVRIFAKCWPLVFQDLGETHLIATPDGHPTIRLENISPVIRRYPNYLITWHGISQSFTHIARVRGSVSFGVSPDFTWAEAKFFWEEDSVTDNRTAQAR